LNKLTHMYLQTYRQFTSLHNEAQSTKASKLSGVYTLLKILRTFTSKSKTRKELACLKDLVTKSKLFDAQWYLQKYPDVASSNIDALEHFLKYGLEELRDPGPGFSTSYYIINNPDLIDAGLPPLKHYILFGADEGRSPIS